MLLSIYKIYTDMGTYVGHTTDFNNRVGWHYSCKLNNKTSKRPIIHAIRKTPTERLRVEELGIYEVDKRSDIEIIERYWINKTNSKLNIQLQDIGNTMYHIDVIAYERETKRERQPDDKINTDFKYNYDVLCITRQMSDMSIDA